MYMWQLPSSPQHTHPMTCLLSVWCIHTHILWHCACSFCLSYVHTHTFYDIVLALFVSHTHTHILWHCAWSVSRSHTHTHTHTSYDIVLALSLSHTHTHKVALSDSMTGRPFHIRLRILNTVQQADLPSKTSETQHHAHSYRAFSNSILSCTPWVCVCDSKIVQVQSTLELIILSNMITCTPHLQPEESHYLHLGHNQGCKLKALCHAIRANCLLIEAAHAHCGGRLISSCARSSLPLRLALLGIQLSRHHVHVGFIHPTLLAAHNWSLHSSQLDNHKQCQTSWCCTRSISANTHVLLLTIPRYWACSYFHGPH